MYVAGKNKEFLARLCRDVQSITLKEAGILDSLRVDILAVAAFIELIYPIKYTIFNVSTGL